jgi:hypothetical protein
VPRSAVEERSASGVVQQIAADLAARGDDGATVGGRSDLDDVAQHGVTVE